MKRIRKLVTVFVVTVAIFGAYRFTEPHVDTSEYIGFEQQVRSFANTAASYHVSVDLSSIIVRPTELFNDTPILGVCIPDQHTVLINHRFWDQADAAEREFLIFHELGHCVLGREHSTWTHEGYPVSLMYPMEWATNHEDYYYAHRTELMRELFKPFQAKLYQIDLKTPSGVVYPLTQPRN